jgi:two-component system OmpR family response regulator
MSEQVLERILYIDDEPDVREIAKISLEIVGGFTLCLCASGRQALAEAEQFRPDMILLDVMMPGMDGPSTLVALRAIDALAKTPVVFMTAKAQSTEIKRYHALGAAEVIPKPFQPTKLPEQLRAIWLACKT